MRGNKRTEPKRRSSWTEKAMWLKSTVSSFLYYLVVVFLFLACQEKLICTEKSQMISHLVCHALVPNNKRHILYINPQRTGRYLEGPLGLHRALQISVSY